MHLVEISTKSTKNMGYAQVTQSPETAQLVTTMITSTVPLLESVFTNQTDVMDILIWLAEGMMKILMIASSYTLKKDL